MQEAMRMELDDAARAHLERVLVILKKHLGEGIVPEGWEDFHFATRSILNVAESQGEDRVDSLISALAHLVAWIVVMGDHALTAEEFEEMLARHIGEIVKAATPEGRV